MHETQLKKKIDFTLDVSSGCRYNCSGCEVEKEDNRLPTEDEFDRLDHLLDTFSENGLELLNIAIGPTDILTSGNRDDVLKSERVKSIVNRFLKLSLNSTFLDPNHEVYDKLAEDMEWLIPNGLLKLTIPFEVKHIENIAYIEGIRKRIEYFESKLKTITITKVYPTVNFLESLRHDRMGKRKVTERIMTKMYNVDVYPNTNVDFILPQGRTDLRNKTNRDELIRGINALNDLHELSVIRSIEKDECYGVAEFELQEGEDWDVFFRNGDIYIPPFISEAFTSYDEVFKIKSVWVFPDIFAEMEGRYINNLSRALEIDDCKGCQFINVCASRGVHSLMDIIDHHECISILSRMQEHFKWERNYE